MRRMCLKTLALVAVIFCAIVMAGAFGILHDQVSYTVSPEYFTKFKFRAFGLAGSPMTNRFKASIVGLLASWWMGIPIGGLTGLAGVLLHRDPASAFRSSLRGLVVVLATTTSVAFIGLGYGYLQTEDIHRSDYDGWFIPDTVSDLRRYLCAGYMHNAAYLGGALGIFVACWSQWRQREKTNP